MWKVPLFELNFSEREAQAVAQVLDSGWITMGERIKEFEARFEEFLGNGAIQAHEGAAHRPPQSVVERRSTRQDCLKRAWCTLSSCTSCPSW